MPTVAVYEPYKGEVERIRDAMVRERAMMALAGGEPTMNFDSCEVSQSVLRKALFTPPGLGMSKRPWRLGTPMVTSNWSWQGIGYVLNARDLDGFVDVWTRKAHRAWAMRSTMLCTLAGGILRGEIKDAWRW